MMETKVYEKMSKARVALQAKRLTKSGRNHHSGFEYFELGDFLPTAQEIFHDVGLCGIVSYTEAVATLTITDVQDGGTIVITSPMSSVTLKGVQAVQNIGALQTYQRRYLWVTALEIVEHDALDPLVGAEPRKTSHSPTAGIFETLSPERKAVVEELVMDMIHLHSAGENDQATELWVNRSMDSDETTAAWHLLKPHSKLRTYITNKSRGNP